MLGSRITSLSENVKSSDKDPLPINNILIFFSIQGIVYLESAGDSRTTNE